MHLTCPIYRRKVRGIGINRSSGRRRLRQVWVWQLRKSLGESNVWLDMGLVPMAEPGYTRRMSIRAESLGAEIGRLDLDDEIRHCVGTRDPLLHTRFRNATAQ